MLKLIELNEGDERELTRGSLEEIVNYLKNNGEVYDWLEEQDDEIELPNLEEIEDIRDLEYELNKVYLSWWSLELKEVK